MFATWLYMFLNVRNVEKIIAEPKELIRIVKNKR